MGDHLKFIIIGQKHEVNYLKRYLFGVVFFFFLKFYQIKIFFFLILISNQFQRLKIPSKRNISTAKYTNNEINKGNELDNQQNLR